MTTSGSHEAMKSGQVFDEGKNQWLNKPWKKRRQLFLVGGFALTGVDVSYFQKRAARDLSRLWMNYPIPPIWEKYPQNNFKALTGSPGMNDQKRQTIIMFGQYFRVMLQPKLANPLWKKPHTVYSKRHVSCAGVHVFRTEADHGFLPENQSLKNNRRKPKVSGKLSDDMESYSKNNRTVWHPKPSEISPHIFVAVTCKHVDSCFLAFSFEGWRILFVKKVAKYLNPS